MARAYRSGIAVKLGPLQSIFIDLFSVKEAEVTFHTVCVGDSATPHDPAKVNRVYRCPECQSDTGFVKGKDVDGTLVVIDPDALKSTGADEDIKQQMVCTAHPLVDVLLSTVPGNMLYYVAPSKAKSVKGFNQAQLDEGYALLKLLVNANPDKALVTVFAPSTKPSMFRFAPFGDKITLTQLEWPESLREAPDLPELELDDTYITLGKQLLDANTQDFDPSLYRDEQKAAREELVAAAARGEIPVTVAAAAPTANAAPSLFAALTAAVETAPPVKKPARKKAAPKTSAA